MISILQNKNKIKIIMRFICRAVIQFDFFDYQVRVKIFLPNTHKHVRARIELGY